MISCGRPGKAGSEETQILCTMLPVWLFVSNVVGDIEGVEVKLLLPAEASPHGYSMRPEDKKKIANADIIVMNGYDVEFELQLGSSIKDENQGATIIYASERITPLFMDGGHHGDDVHQGNGIRDPHTWVSPKQAIVVVENIRDRLAEVDSSHAEGYRTNAAKFIDELEQLVTEYEEASSSFKKRQIVTGHHAFAYLARDFNIEIVAVIEEIPQQEPSAGELRELADAIKATGAAAIFTEPQVRSDVAMTIAEATGLPVGILDPIGTGKMDPGEYIRVMRKNLEELKRTLM